jgi:hypothetical protein
MPFVIPYKGCKIHMTDSVWEGGKEFASYEVAGANHVTKAVLARKPIKGRAAPVKALEAAKHKIDQLFGKSR